jgi:hypothetical protein
MSRAQGHATPKWSEITYNNGPEDCLDRRMWAMVDDGTDLYVIEQEPDVFYVVRRDDARQPNADGYRDDQGEWRWHPDETVSGPFPTLDGARVAYLVAARHEP